MGEYFLVVNPVKKQYLNARRFGENVKRSGILNGKHAMALGLLLCDSKGEHPLFGSWVGDPVMVAGDYSNPNPAGIQTSTEETPTRNLNDVAREEYEDISRDAIIMLMSEWDYWIDCFVEDAKTSRWLLIELGYIVFQNNFEPLRESLEKFFGRDWTKRFKEICEEDSGRRIKTSIGQHKYRLEVAAIPHAPNLAEAFKKSDLQVHIDSCVTALWSTSDAQGIWLGKNVPSEIAVPAIKLAVKEWDFLCYVMLSNEFNSPPEFTHDEIYFGGNSKHAESHQTQPWTDTDFNTLQPTMKLSQLHDFVKGFYKT